MKTLIHILCNWMVARLRERWYLWLEDIALRHQVDVLKRSATRPQFSSADRCLWLFLSSRWPKWPQALEIMQADTVRRWRRQGMRHHFSWRRGRKRPGRPPIPSDTRDLIRAMSRDNVLWGAPRIHGELRKLGINVSRTTVAKYMLRRPYPPSPTWRTFLRLHGPDLIGCEASAECLQRLRALSIRIMHALRRWLDRLVVGERRREARHEAVLRTPPNDTAWASTAWTVDLGERISVSGRSPPDSRFVSPAPLSDAHVPKDVGRVAVRLAAFAMQRCVVSPFRQHQVPGQHGQGAGMSQRAAA